MAGAPLRKILIATPHFPPEIGGPATHAKLLAERFPGQGIEVAILPFAEVRRFPKVLRHAAYFLKVLSRCRDADLIYALDPVSVGVPALLAAILMQKRFVVRIAGDYAWEQGIQRFKITDTLDVFSQEYGKYSYFVQLLKDAERFVARHAEKVIVPSAYLKTIVANWKVPSEKIRVVYNAFAPIHVSEDRETLRAIFKMEGSTIVSVGRLVPWKGFEGLIRALPLVRESIPDAVLVVAGDGPLKQKLDTLVHELGIAPHVTFLGAIDQRLLYKYLKASDLFVLNTSYEGFSHLILEAMSVRVPIVTTPVGGNSEILEGGKDAILVAPDDIPALVDSIVAVLKDPFYAERLVDSASSKVSTFTEERAITELMHQFNG